MSARKSKERERLAGLAAGGGAGVLGVVPERGVNGGFGREVGGADGEGGCRVPPCVEPGLNAPPGKTSVNT